MKTHKNLFEPMCSPENLALAFRKARKHKTLKPYVQKFEKNLAENLKQLQKELVSETYVPLPLKTFILRDPKTRKISVSDFRDRIVHHAVCNILEPIFDKCFIYDSYANRKGKGALAALKRFDEFKRKVSQNGRKIKGAKDDNYVMGYALKADVKHYFDTVSHDKLVEILQKKIADRRVLSLIRKILGNHSCKTAGRGMPLGNLTSQFFANVYLNELDWFVKHELKAEYYLRYVDDFVILHRSQEQLHIWKRAINAFLQNGLLLTLHPQKSSIHSLGSGTDFLGFKCFYYFRLLRARNTRKMLARINRFKTGISEGKTTPQKILESLQGWKAYASHANTYKLQRQIANKAIALVQKPRVCFTKL